MNPKHWLGAAALAGALAATAQAAVDVQQYALDAGSKYSYLPSPFLPIPGGMPSETELEFGVSGLFSVEYDRMANTAKFLDLDLTLSGNEAVQNDPPPYGLVTADRLEEWLAGRLFELEPLGAPINLYLDQTLEGLAFTDFLVGRVTLTGGYNATFVDGDGIEFAWSAAAVPEPTTFALGIATFGWSIAVARGRQRSIRA